MSECTHDLAERETACADGMCPQCLADDNKALFDRNEELKDIVSYMRLTMLNAAKERNG